MRNKIRMAFHAATGIMILSLTHPVEAKDPFEVNLDINGQTASQGYANLESAINTLSNNGLKQLVPNYTDTSAVAANVNLRGLGFTATFAEGSNALTVVIPAAGINRTFEDVSRTASAEQFRRFLEGRGGSSSLFRALVANTPTDPVAGNPNSLMNQMVGADFGRALSGATSPSSASAGVEARYGSFSAAGFNSQGISLPLDYSWRLSARDALEVDVPISVTDTGGAKSYSGNVGVLWRHRVLPNWTLQPSVRIGAAGSRDLGSGSGVWSAALNSTVSFDLPGTWQLTVANGITYISTIPVTVGKYSLDYNLSNIVFRNGLVASRDLGFRLMNLPMRGSVYAIDTRFIGDAVYIKNYQELGLFATAGSQAPIRLGAAYLLGDHGVKGFTVSTGVRF